MILTLIIKFLVLVISIMEKKVHYLDDLDIDLSLGPQTKRVEYFNP